MGFEQMPEVALASGPRPAAQVFRRRGAPVGVSVSARFARAEPSRVPNRRLASAVLVSTVGRADKRGTESLSAFDKGQAFSMGSHTDGYCR